MYIKELGNLSQSTLRDQIKVTPSTEFSFNIPLNELNESMKLKIDERLNTKGGVFSDVTAVYFFAMPDSNFKSMCFEISVYYPESGDEWKGCENIPVKLTDEEFKQFKENCLVPVIANLIQV